MAVLVRKPAARPLISLANPPFTSATVPVKAEAGTLVKAAEGTLPKEGAVPPIKT